MDRTAMIEAAREKAMAERNYPTGINNLGIAFRDGFDACLKLFQFKRISTADDLPTVDGWYWGYTKSGLRVERYFHPQINFDRDKWLAELAAYIPIPIPQFKEGEDDTKV